MSKVKRVTVVVCTDNDLYRLESLSFAFGFKPTPLDSDHDINQWVWMDWQLPIDEIIGYIADIDTSLLSRYLKSV